MQDPEQEALGDGFVDPARGGQESKRDRQGQSGMFQRWTRLGLFQNRIDLFFRKPALTHTSVS